MSSYIKLSIWEFQLEGGYFFYVKPTGIDQFLYKGDLKKEYPLWK